MQTQLQDSLPSALCIPIANPKFLLYRNPETVPSPLYFKLLGTAAVSPYFPKRVTPVPGTQKALEIPTE